MKKIIKWLECKFKKKCIKRPKWEQMFLHEDGKLDVKCRECGMVRKRVLR